MPELAMDRIRKMAASRDDGVDVAGRLGGAVLSAFSVTQLHGLMNPSYEEIRERAADPEKAEAVREGLRLSLALELGAAGLIGLAFSDWVPGAVAGGLSLALFGLGEHALKTPIETVE